MSDFELIKQRVVPDLDPRDKCTMNNEQDGF